MEFSNKPISVLAFVEKYQDLNPVITYHLVRRDLLRKKFYHVQLENGRLFLIDNKENYDLAAKLTEDKKGPKFKKDKRI